MKSGIDTRDLLNLYDIFLGFKSHLPQYFSLKIKGFETLFSEGNQKSNQNSKVIKKVIKILKKGKCGWYF